MKEILTKINRIPGVRGTLIVGSEGFVIASDVASGGSDAQTLGAVASSVAANLSTSLERMRQGKLTRFVMNGSEDNVVLTAIEGALLLTLVKKDANMGMVMVELKDAACELAGKL